jgi:hypothetical protein
VSWSGSMRMRGPGTCMSICRRTRSDTVSKIWRMRPRFVENSDKPMRRKGELSPSEIDRKWPHQVVLPARACEGGDAVCHDNEWYHIYCFADVADAEKFKQRFGGEMFNPSEKGRGRNWAHWNRP